MCSIRAARSDSDAASCEDLSEFNDESGWRPPTVPLPVCSKLGDERTMIKASPMGCLAHDRCVFEHSQSSERGEGEVHLGGGGAGYAAEAGRRGVSVDHAL